MTHIIRIRSPKRQRGFSLVEVLVALIVISVGLLGLAKMQGLAYASTSNSSERSLAALEVSSLISAMRANRSYWTTLPAALNLTLTGATIAGDATLATPYECRALLAGISAPTATNAPCLAPQLASYDLHTWATNLNALLPGVTGSIQCTQVSTSTPVGCWVQLNWAERTAAINTQSANAASATPAALAIPRYTLYVVP